MKFGGFAARFALVASCALATVVPAQARFWQCAPYAREISGIQIFGNANTWWSQAAGKYERGNAPKVGAVLSFARPATCGSAMSRPSRRSSATAKSCSTTPIGRAAAGSNIPRARSTSRRRATGAKSRCGTARRAGSARRPIRPTASSIRTARRRATSSSTNPSCRSCRWPAPTPAARRMIGVRD